MTDSLTHIGRYQLVAPIGLGGMGALYRAWDPQLDRQIAIKVLVRDDPELRERFAREARSAAGLRHPNIVTIHDVGEHEGQPFIAMEYIQGKTLAKIIEDHQPLSQARKIELLEELCNGLSFAHKAGIVHRDVKPANLIVSTEGQLKILDFGIARVAQATGMTQTGMLIGTLNYMSPEQMSGLEVDSRSDIFAVGAVCYELLCYAQAFPGEVAASIFHGILYGAPIPLATQAPELDPELIRIVERAMEKEPRDRYQDLAVMGADLQRVRQRLLQAEAPGPTVILEPDPPPAAPPPVAAPPAAPPPTIKPPATPPPVTSSPPTVPPPLPAPPRRRRILSWQLLTGMLLLLTVIAVLVLAIRDQPAQEKKLDTPTVTPTPPPEVTPPPPTPLPPPPQPVAPPPPPPQIEEPPPAAVDRPPPPPSPRPTMSKECVKLLERLSLGEALNAEEEAFLKRHCRSS